MKKCVHNTHLKRLPSADAERLLWWWCWSKGVVVLDVDIVDGCTMAMRGFNGGGDTIILRDSLKWWLLLAGNSKGIGALWDRLRCDTRLSLWRPFPPPPGPWPCNGGDGTTFGPSTFPPVLPFSKTLCGFMAPGSGGGGYLARLDIGRWCKRSIDDGFFGMAGGGGDRFSTVDARNSGFLLDDPAKLFRRLATGNLLSGSDSCRMWRNSSGGGGGSGSSWTAITASSAALAGGGGGKSGLGIRSMGFFGGRSGTQSSSEMIGPITMGPSKSFDSACFSRLWSRTAAYSEADEVLKEWKKVSCGSEN